MMLSLGNMRNEAPFRWAAVVAIRGVLVAVALCLVSFAALTPVCRRSRITKARAETAEFGKAVGIHLILTGRMPASLDDLRAPQPKYDGDPLVEFMVDPWGHPFGFTVDGPRAVTITCFGADGEPGGEGADEDIVLHWPPLEDPSPR
jgi:hypothetical protein